MFRQFWAFWLTLAVVVTPQATVAQTIDELRQQGETAYHSGNYAQAELIWRRVINQQPDSVAYFWLGCALYYQGKFAEAEQSFRRALELDPEYAAPHVGLGNALYNQGNLTEAVQSYRRALSLPDEKTTPASAHTLAHNGLGYALQQQGNLQAAIAEYNKAIQLDPNFTTAQNNLREAERLLAQQKTPPPPSDLAAVPSPEEEPLVYELRSTVHIFIPESPDPQVQGAEYGAGWIFKREGDTIWIITNRHVIQPQGANRPSDTIEVQFFSTLDYNQRPRYSATLEHITDPDDPLDLAILKVEGIREDDDTIRPLKFHSGYIPRAQEVIVIGHPRQLDDYEDWDVVAGIISSAGTDGLTLDARLNDGNSGGPILHAETKEVIGIVAFIRNQEVRPWTTGLLGSGHTIEQVANQLRRWRLIN